MSVFHTTYEIVGEGIAVAKAHEAEVARCHAAGWDIAKRYGAAAYRFSHGQGIRSLIFAGKEPPAGFKYDGRPAADQVEVTPHKGSKLGKQAAADLLAAPTPPKAHAVASALGWTAREVIHDGYKIYWPSFYPFKVPEERYFLHIPRKAGDGFEPDARLHALPESALMLAMEAHNAAAKAQREAA